MCDLGRYEDQLLVGQESGIGSRLICKTMYAWKQAVSPHLAAERESGPVDDAVVLQSLQSCLTTGLEASGESDDAKTRAMCLVETAGGVASPGPSGSLQCDLYRCLQDSIIVPRSIDYSTSTSLPCPALLLFLN